MFKGLKTIQNSFGPKWGVKLGFDPLIAEEIEPFPCTPFIIEQTISSAQVLKAVKNGVSTLRMKYVEICLLVTPLLFSPVKTFPLSV